MPGIRQIMGNRYLLTYNLKATTPVHDVQHQKDKHSPDTCHVGTHHIRADNRLQGLGQDDNVIGIVVKLSPDPR